jgi:DNA helicase-2/ATP-dependent DNA helicase PcrA
MPTTVQPHTLFEKLYKALNQEQKKAVDTIEGPVMVIAGPGTGKTVAPKFAALRPLGKPDAYTLQILRAIDDAKREALLAKDIKIFIKQERKRVETDENSISSRGATKGMLKAEARDYLEKCDRTLLFGDVYDLYENEKRQAKKLDFNDLIFEFLVKLQTSELFLRLVQERFLYIHVDEHQDTNDAQNLIIALIAEFFETPNVFIVGDEKQAIYRFQGASVENFLHLRKLWPGMKLITLDTNYRSHQDILDASFSMIEKNYADGEYIDLRIKLMSGSRETIRPLEIVNGENVTAVEVNLVERLKAILQTEPEVTIAVITRRNRDLERILRVIEASGIPVSSQRSIDIFHHPVGMLFFDLLEYIDDSTKIDALGRTVAAHMWGLTFEKSLALIRALKAGNTKDLEKTIPVLKDIQNKMMKDSALECLIDIAGLSGLTRLVIEDPAYVYVWRGIVTLAETIIRESGIENSADLFRALLAYKRSAESKTVKVSVGTPDLPVKVMTAHGSKGLEFDYVFLPYTTEEAWVGRTRGSSFVLPQKQVSDNEIRDIRRLFYVALTRARKHAVIFSPQEESDGRKLVPLRFIAELDPLCITAQTLPRQYIELPTNDAFTEITANTYSYKIIAEAKRVLTESGLSVTALNHFLECPNKFLYESILKLPQTPHPSAEKGTAMHEAISVIWHSKDKTVKSIQDTIHTEIRSYLENSYLNLHEKELVKKELTEAAAVVAKELRNHFAQKGNVVTERFFKANFEGTYDDEPVQIKIHGKLDAVIEGNGEVDVFDYKTKQAMSVNAIKGQTKDSNGEYFRQLVYYKLLLQNDQYFKSQKINTSLVFVSPDKKNKCPIVTLPVNDSDIYNVKQEIQEVINSVWSGKLASATCSDTECEYCKLRKVIK